MHTFTLRFSDGVMTVDEAGLVTALTVGGDSLLAEKSPLFRFGIRMSDGSLQALPMLHTSAWEAEGKRVQILVNPFDEAVRCKLGGRALTVPANDAILLPI